MVGSRKCAQHLRDANRYNPAPRRGLAGNYFSSTCPDPYTSLAYWRRRFNTQNCYLGSYFVPYTRPGNNFGTSTPYNANGFSLGKACPMLMLPPRNRTGKRWRCNNARYNNARAKNCTSNGRPH